MSMPWQKTKRIQPSLKLTEDSRILEPDLPVYKGVAVDEDTREAWVLFPDALIPGENGIGPSTLVINERDTAPVLLGGTKENIRDAKSIREMVNAISHECREEAHVSLDKEHKQSWLNNWLPITILSITLLFILMVIVGLISNGTLHLPG